DIVIRNNVIETGSGSGMQGVFLRDETGVLPYQRVTIDNNIVIGKNMSNGIMVSHGNDVRITNNTVISPTDDSYPVRIRLGGDGPVTNVTSYGNVADSGGQKLTTEA